MPKVAVYGTLREGHGNHTLIEQHDQLGIDTLKGFDMYSAGGFPVIYPSDNDDSVIVVEVYDVSDRTLQGPLDRLEGHPNWYRRQLVGTSFGKAWIYVMQSDSYKKNTKINSGDWSDK